LGRGTQKNDLNGYNIRASLRALIQAALTGHEFHHGESWRLVQIRGYKLTGSQKRTE